MVLIALAALGRVMEVIVTAAMIATTMMIMPAVSQRPRSAVAGLESAVAIDDLSYLSFWCPRSQWRGSKLICLHTV